MNGSYLGPKLENNMIEDKLKNLKANYKKQIQVKLYHYSKRII